MTCNVVRRAYLGSLRETSFEASGKAFPPWFLPFDDAVVGYQFFANLSNLIRLSVRL